MRRGSCNCNGGDAVTTIECSISSVALLNVFFSPKLTDSG